MNHLQPGDPSTVDEDGLAGDPVSGGRAQQQEGAHEILGWARRLARYLHGDELFANALIDGLVGFLAAPASVSTERWLSRADGVVAGDRLVL